MTYPGSSFQSSRCEPSDGASGEVGTWHEEDDLILLSATKMDDDHNSETRRTKKLA